jgi:IclR family transcriptional regulator, pca regulon regulatory protein
MTEGNVSIEVQTNRTDRVGSLERGLGVMEILAAHPAGLTMSGVADRAGLTRAGARRFLLTLVATGYARQDASSACRRG